MNWRSPSIAEYWVRTTNPPPSSIAIWDCFASTRVTLPPPLQRKSRPWRSLGTSSPECFARLSEDQQLALQDNVRIALDNYLTLADRVHAADAAVYAWVLKCKGAVTAEQFLIHLQRRKSGVAKLFDELQATATRLSALDGELSALSGACPIPKGSGKG